jgi:hydroxymethylbilane synthase
VGRSLGFISSSKISRADVTIKIATRGSPLALWQANYVKMLIEKAAGTNVQLARFTTEADRRRDTPLSDAGGKGLFIKELEAALLDGRADIAVHSMKDVPALLPDGLDVIVVGERGDVRDALVAGDATFDTLVKGARVGSSSLRRRSQLKLVRPDLEIIPIRGNVGTRLQKLKNGDCDALILACAGLDRLGLEDHISQRLSIDLSLPAVGQGALAVEYQSKREDIVDLLAKIVVESVERTVSAERALTKALGGDCTMPLGALSVVENGGIRLSALLADADGERILRVSEVGEDPLALGNSVAGALIKLGAVDLIGQA